jgi:hypothetical protein
MRPVYAPEDNGYADEDDLETPETLDGDADDEDADADDADDEPEDEDLEAGGEPLEHEQRPARGANRIQTLANERAAERARADRLEAELEAIRAERSRGAADATAAAERERLALMDPTERAVHEMRQQMGQIQFQSWDTNDKVAFEALAASNPALSRLKGEVETTFRQQVANGKPIDRQTIAAFLIGQKALNAAPKARAAGKRVEAAGKERNTTKPGSGRGDTAPNRNRNDNTAAARRARLDGQSI